MKSKRKAQTAREPICVSNGDFGHDIEDAANEVMSGEPPFYLEPTLAHQVVGYLQEYKKELIANGRYMAAQEVEDKCNEVKVITTTKSFSNCQQQQIYELECRVQIAKDGLKKVKRKKEAKLKEHKNFHDQELAELLNTQKADLQKFETEHKNPKSRFLKYSKYYLNLRKREQFMVKSKSYVDAHHIKVEADALQIQEQEQMNVNWLTYVEQQRQIKLNQHQVQLLALEERYEQRLSALLPVLDDKVSKAEKLLQGLEKKLNDAQSYSLPPITHIGEEAFKMQSENVLTSRMNRMRTSNYQQSRDQELFSRTALRRPKTAIH